MTPVVIFVASCLVGAAAAFALHLPKLLKLRREIRRLEELQRHLHAGVWPIELSQDSAHLRPRN